jgi:RNA polymerase sigma factor (sigma-70 family)
MRSQQPCEQPADDVLARWVVEYGERILGTVVANGVSSRDAEDVLQGVWVKVLDYLRRGEPVPNSPEAWLKALARRAARDHLRKCASEARRRRGRAAAGMVPTQVHPEAERQRAAIEKMIDEMLDEIELLEPSLRDVLDSRLSEHLTVREIADRLGVHTNTVCNWQRRALQGLRPKLEALREELEGLGMEFLPTRQQTPIKTSRSS